MFALRARNLFSLRLSLIAILTRKVQVNLLRPVRCLMMLSFLVVVIFTGTVREDCQSYMAFLILYFNQGVLFRGLHRDGVPKLLKAPIVTER